MKKIAENTADFERLRRADAVYVDKTGYFHDLIASNERSLFFVARPRRFGKSLMISTLQAIFEGRRELFEGLEISRRAYDWQKWPVLRFNFSGIKTSSLEVFQKDFAEYVEDVIRSAGLEVYPEKAPGRTFMSAMQALFAREGKQVVILIDEYDAPIGHALHDLKLANAIREELSNFYIQIKDNEARVRFLMMTGVAQFPKLSVFSALNNLTDLTLDPSAAALLGYTEAELLEAFDEHLHEHAQVMGLPYEAYIEKLRAWCDGYCFSECFDVRVYNPVSVGINLTRKRKNYQSSWVNTGRATMLMNFLRKNELLEMDYEHVENVTEGMLNAYDLDALPTVSLLHQMGYLTIKDYKPARNVYTLGVPNDEVREDLARLVVYSQKGEYTGASLHAKLCNALLDAQFEEAQEVLSALYAGLTYGSREKTDVEAPYQRMLQVFLSAGGFRVQSEVQQAVGRVDTIAFHAEGIFVFELKVNAPVELALDQIREKHYTLPYLAEDVPVYAIGLTFDSTTRNVKELKHVRIV